MTVRPPWLSIPTGIRRSGTALLAPQLASVLLALAVFAAAAPAVAQQALPLLRISTENTADHTQTRAVARFAELLSRRAAGRLTVEHHGGAALFRDRDVIKALHDGKVEMAVPGTWQLDRFAPDVGIFLLPEFYGVPAEAIHAVTDGATGQEISRRIAQAVGVEVPGRWLDLGHAHVFGISRPVRGYADLAGMRIRIAGGTANAVRLESLGAAPKVIPWPDLRARIARGEVDGLLTTYETVVSDRLWEAGVTSAFEDRQYFPMYVPMIARAFWARLPADLRGIVEACWEEGVDQARREAAEAQQEARRNLAARGVRIAVPTPGEVGKTRAALLAEQDRIVGELGIDPALLAAATATLGNARAK